MKKPLCRRYFNRVLAFLAMRVPGATTLRPLLHRWRGVKIEGRVFIGDLVVLETEYPECIEIRDGAQISVRCTILAHLRGPGHVVIEENVLIGPHSVVAAASGCKIVIGKGSVIGALSPITKSIPEGVMVRCGEPHVVGLVGRPLTLDASYTDFILGLKRPEIREES